MIKSRRFITTKSFLIATALGCSIFAFAQPALADISSDTSAAYLDSLDALNEVAALISGGEDDFYVLNAAAIDLHQRTYDAAQIHADVYACGEPCRPLQGTINAAVANFEDALIELDDLGIYYGFFLDWCCATESGGNYYGCQAIISYHTICGGICWSCKEGWSNADGSLGCADGYEQDCPK